MEESTILKAVADWENSAKGFSYIERAQSLVELLNSKICFPTLSVSHDKEQLILKEILSL